MEDDEWRFGLDEVDENGIVDATTPIEPEPITVEHAVFVVLGILTTVIVLLRLTAII